MLTPQCVPTYPPGTRRGLLDAYNAMFALVDCNNFFVSCERVRNPQLEGRPVIVLSNNDGCAVALSNEAKALGIKRGDPLFKVKHIVERNGVVALSGDHHFYAAVSHKVMDSLAELDLGLEVYSVDEAYLKLPTELGDLAEFGRYVGQKVRQDTGVPVSIGIASTRTLAKVAARFAKKYPGYLGCCLIDNEQRRLKALGLTDITDVWGIGRRLAPKLRLEGIYSALDFATLPRNTVNKLYGVTGERTWRELNGEPCIGHTKEETAKSIMASRSFEHDIYTLAELEQVICVFAGIIGKKLRRQEGFATEVGVFIGTNRFNTNRPQYYKSAVIPLEEATNFTPHLAGTARQVLRSVWRQGYGYKRAGVFVPKVIPAAAVQRGLFDDPRLADKRKRLMRVADTLSGHNPGSPPVRIAAMGDGLRPFVRSSAPGGEQMPHVGEDSLPFGF